MSVARMMEVREQIGRLRLALDALPTRPLARSDELDTKERELVAQRLAHQQRLDALEAPKGRFGRSHDPHARERMFLGAAVGLDDPAISDVRAERARLHRELGDPDQVRSEKDGIETAITQLQREHDAVRATLCQRAIAQRPAWLINTLGAPPQLTRDRRVWDHAADTLAGFRLDHNISDPADPLGAGSPIDGQHRQEREQVKAVFERAQRQLGRESPAHDRGVDVGLG